MESRVGGRDFIIIFLPVADIEITEAQRCEWGGVLRNKWAAAVKGTINPISQNVGFAIRIPM